MWGRLALFLCTWSLVWGLARGEPRRDGLQSLCELVQQGRIITLRNGRRRRVNGRKVPPPDKAVAVHFYSLPSETDPQLPCRFASSTKVNFFALSPTINRTVEVKGQIGWGQSDQPVRINLVPCGGGRVVVAKHCREDGASLFGIHDSSVIVVASPAFSHRFSSMSAEDQHTIRQVIGAISSKANVAIGLDGPSMRGYDAFFGAATPNPPEYGHVTNLFGDYRVVLNMGMTITSQNGEDMAIAVLLGGRLGKGRFVEMGALNGLLFSNSHPFATTLGWKGVMLEPGDSFKEAYTNRPGELMLNGAACQGVSATFLDEGKPAESKLVGEGEQNRRTKRVECLDLGELMEQMNFPVIDFFSLDVEGHEQKVLGQMHRHLDPSVPEEKRTKVGIFIIEDNHQGQEARHLVGGGRGMYRSLGSFLNSQWLIHKEYPSQAELWPMK